MAQLLSVVAPSSQFNSIRSRSGEISTPGRRPAMKPLRGLPPAFSTKAITVPATMMGYALLFFAADLALNRFAFSDGWTILWPLNGAIIALLLMRPRSAWPIMLLGVEIGTGVGEYLDGNPIGQEILLRLISLTEVLISASLLPAFSSLNHWLRQPRIFLRFLAALILGPAISGVMAAIFFHLVQARTYLNAFDGWAAADALGIAATMPLALSLRSPEMRQLFRRRSLGKTVSILALAFSAAAIVFSVSRYPLLFLLYPALLLVDSLLAFAGSAIVVVGISGLSVYLATHGIGPFGVWSRDLPVSRDVALQIYLGFNMVALFPASILIMERKRMASEIRDTNAQLLMLASLDGLTGIANRRSLEERFAQEWNRASRLHMPLALVMIDIDHFKQFNDSYGHHGGDQCLRAVADALRGKVRRVQDHAARYGGEEFALLLPHTDVEGAAHLAESIRLAVADLNIPHRGCEAGQVTVSIGCAAIIPELGEDKSVLLRMADAALYEAKRSGRNCIRTNMSATQSVA